MKAKQKMILSLFIIFAFLWTTNLDVRINSNNGKDIFNAFKGKSVSNPIEVTKDVAYAASDFDNIPRAVVNSTYDTSGNGGRKITKLSNGWLVASAKYSSTYIYFYVSKDNGVSWQQLCYENANYIYGFAITSKDNTVYCIYTTTSGGNAYLLKFDAATVTNGNIQNPLIFDTSQTSYAPGCSITVGTDGVLHAVWASRNSAYPNYYNIRYSKSADGAIWAAPTQVSTNNIYSSPAGYDVQNPTIVLVSNKPVIISQYRCSTGYGIYANPFDGTSWLTSNYGVGMPIFTNPSYIQYSPSACVTSDGTIHVVWFGEDNTSYYYNSIRYGKSTDGGKTWTANVLYMDSIYHYTQEMPSITCDKNNYLYVYWQGPFSNGYNQIRRMKYMTSWSSVENVTNNTYNNSYYPSLLYDPTIDYSKGEPFVIWQDYQSNAVIFKGTVTSTALTTSSIFRPNLLGSGGDLESTSGWSCNYYNYLWSSPDSSNKVTGTYGMKTTISYPYSGQYSEGLNKYLNSYVSMIPGKYYCISAYLKNGDAASGVTLRVENNGTVLTANSTDSAQFVRKNIKFLYNGGGVYLYLWVTGSYNQYGYYDSAMMNEISKSEYDDPNYLPPDFTAVTPSSRSISGNGGGKIVKLANGSLILGTYASGEGKLYFYRSDDNGQTWKIIKTINAAASGLQVNYSMTSLPDNSIGCLYTITGNSSYTSALYQKFNADDPNDYITSAPDKAQSYFGLGCSLVLGKDGTLHAVWTSRNSTTPSYYNIRYANSKDGGVTWSNAEQLSTDNSYDNTYPSITLKDDVPLVVWQKSTSIMCKYYTIGSGWIWGGVGGTIYSSSYSQNRPYAVTDNSGAIHVVWDGYEATNPSIYNINYSQSTDGGATWKAVTRLTTGNSYSQYAPVIAFDKNNNLYVLFNGIDPIISTSYNNIRVVRYTNSSWTGIQTLTSNNAGQAMNPQVIQYPDSSIIMPAYIYEDNQSGMIRYLSIPSKTPSIVSINSPIADKIFTLNDASISPYLSVYDGDSSTLACRYYMDFETTPRETKTITNNWAAQTVSFSPIDISSISDGEHTVKFELTDGEETLQSSVSFTVDKSGPEAGVRITSTDDAITITASAADNINIGTDSFRYTMDAASSDWTSDTSYTWNKLKPNTPYLIKFEAKDNAGNIYKYEESIYTKAHTPNISINNVTSNTADLHIEDENTIETLYQIVAGPKYVDSLGNLTSSPSWFTVSTKNIKLVGLSPNTSYDFQVRAKNAANIETAFSRTAGIKTETLVLNAPVNLSFKATNTTIALSWGEVTDALEYEVEVDGALVKKLYPNTYTVKGLIPNSQHIFRVRASSPYGISSWSQGLSAMTTFNPPGEIGSIDASASNTAITLTWQDAVDADEYDVEFDGMVFENSINTFCTKVGLKPSSSHTFRVRSKNPAGIGNWSGLQSVTTYLLDTPRNVDADEEDTFVNLTWDKVDGAAGYEIEVNGQIIATVSTNSFRHEGLLPETQYDYRIRAVNSNGNSSFSNRERVLTLPVRPAVPDNITGMTVNNIATITWDKVDGAIGYDVELDGVVIDNGDSTIYAHEDLGKSTYHAYRIRAKNDAIEGDWSSALSLKTMVGKPVAPSNIQVSTTPTITTLMWDSQDDALGYDIEIDGTVVDNISKTEFKHRRLTPLTEHRYRIRTRNITGVSSWSGYIINNSIKALCKKGKDVDLGLTASDIVDFSKYTLTVNYDPKVIEVTDLSTLSSTIELTTGRIDGTGITITSFTPGHITFVVDKTIPPGESWSGVINSIGFKAKVSGGTSITYAVFSQPEEEQ